MRGSALVFLALLTAACGEGQLPADWHSESTAIAARPVLTALPASVALSFVNGSPADEVDVVNDSAASVWVTRASLSGAGSASFSVVPSISLPVSLVAGGKLPFYVSLTSTATEGGATSATLEVAQDAGPSVQVQLSRTP